MHNLIYIFAAFSQFQLKSSFNLTDVKSTFLDFCNISKVTKYLVWYQFNSRFSVEINLLFAGANLCYLFFSPCLSIIKLNKYSIGKWSQLLNKVFILYFYFMIRTVDSAQIVQLNTALSTFLLAKHITSCDNIF